jgi:altronate dehydratase
LTKIITFCFSCQLFFKGRYTVRRVGERIFRILLEVASRKRTKPENLGHYELGISRIGVRT